ncbi:MAG TPA: sulfatase-like hydrolase/transferase [Pirellulales bacterium]|nr:sulfatase-like hydrolase/transferase [Pirellulales bacterium]
MNLLVVVVDRLHAGFLGCYGNAWVATPHFNRLAADSYLFDQAYVDQPDLHQLYESWWSGTHPLERHGGRVVLPLPARLNQAGYATTCLTDEPLVADHPWTAEFDAVIRVGVATGDPRPTELAATTDDTQAARLFAAAAHFLETARRPFCLWLHSRGLEGAWDAPYHFREGYADDGEAPPPLIVEPPCRALATDDDPDELWGLCQAYAGQVGLVDECLGGLWEQLDAARLTNETALIVLGARGFPLGRNSRFGDTDQALYGELVQTPWLMRFPDRLGAAARTQSLVQPSDLMPTLCSVASLGAEIDSAGRDLLPVVRNEVTAVREGICLVGRGGERAFRTPAWYLRIPPANAAGEETPLELYTKPDDRWEINDVAGRCPDTVAAMRVAHDVLAERLASGQSHECPALDESLTSDLR